MATSTDPVLYMFPMSFYSQKVRLALRQKGVKHKERLINIREGEQNSGWYLRLNPNGEVPMMKIANEYFAQSEKLIDIIDKLPSDLSVRLVPDRTTAEGKEVAALRGKLDKVDCRNLTYGVIVNPELSVDGLIMVSLLQPSKGGKNFTNVIKKLQKRKRENSESDEATEKTTRLSHDYKVSMCDKENCIKIMDQLERLMDEVELQLQKTKSKNRHGHWLCGPNFTAADIDLCVLLGRMVLIGILSRYIIPDKRPALTVYWNMAKQQPNVKTIVLDNIYEMKMIILIRKLKTVALLTTGVVLGAWMAYKFVSWRS